MIKKNSGESKIIYSRSDESEHSESEDDGGPIPMQTPRRKALRCFDDSDDFKFAEGNSESCDVNDFSDSDIGATPRRKPFRILDDTNAMESDSDGDIIKRATPRRKPLRISDDSDEENKSESRRNLDESNGEDSSDSEIVIRPTPRKIPLRILDNSDDVVKRFNKISMVDDDTSDFNDSSKSPSNKEADIIEILSDDSTSSFEDNAKQKSQIVPKLENFSKISKLKKGKNSITSLPEVRLSFLSSLSDVTYGLPLHPKAKEFAKTYSKTKEDLALFLYQYYNFHVFNKKLPDIPLKWSSRLTSTAGRARMSRNKGVSMDWNYMIELSNVLLSSAAQLRDTLVHEMCHVATCEIDKLPNANHGPPWKAWASKCRQVFPELPVVQVCHQYERHWKYVYVCRCPKTKGTMTKIPGKKLHCRVCGEKMSLQR